MKKIALTISVIIFSVPLIAQQQTLPESLLPGNRVRVTAPQFFQKIKISQPSKKIACVVGTVMATNADTLFLKVENQPESLIMSVPFASLRKLEVSRGRQPQVLTGAGVGFVVGAAAGALLFKGSSEHDLSDRDARLIGAGLLGISGTLIGAVIGANKRGDRWEEVPLK